MTKLYRRLSLENIWRKKLKATKEGVHVSVYRIRDKLDVSSKKFQIIAAAKKLYMSGVVAVLCDCCLVIVEGGPKQQNQFQLFMMNFIRRNAHEVGFNQEIQENRYLTLSTCDLVLQTKIQRRNFGEIKIKVFSFEQEAFNFFHSYQCEQYLELARFQLESGLTNLI